MIDRRPLTTDMLLGDSPPPLLPSKRKLDDLSSPSPSLTSPSPSPSPSQSSSSPSPSSRMLQFFVRVGSRSRVFLARPDDTVEDLHSRICDATGIPSDEQRLIYSGRQLHRDLTLAQCGVTNDSCLHLSGRLRSMQYARAWTLANDLLSSISSARYDHLRATLHDPAALVRSFLRTATSSSDETPQFLHVFVLSGAASALAMLYLSPVPDRRRYCRAYAECCILLFVQPDSDLYPDSLFLHTAPVLLEFCRLFFGRVPCDDPLYSACRSKLGSLLDHPDALLDHPDASCFLSINHHRRPLDVINELLPFTVELGGMVRNELLKCLNDCASAHPSCFPGPVLAEFSNFLRPLGRAIEVSMRGGDGYRGWIPAVRRMFVDLLDVVNRCLKMVEDEILIKGRGEFSECQLLAWSSFLVVLTELNGITKVLKGEGKVLRKVLMERRVPLNVLLGRVKRNAGFRWFLQLEDVTDFEARRNLALMLFPEDKEDYEDMHEMLIDRSNLLAESFEYITNADPVSLQNSIFMEFKNEDATGPGVLREWFYLLSQAIFNPQNVLFTPCPNDHRRFFPNPTSAVDPLHLKYFGFCGRIVALALRQRVALGIVFDRVFYQQLAGKSLTLEDIQAADPVFYASCKKILEMEAELLDSDALGLTFERELEELGARRLVELCPGGKEIAVNSTNREKYVDLLIHHHFVTSISRQVACFAQGFADIISSSDCRLLFFQCLKLEDFDRMIGGKEGDICVEDWKTHTDYKGYRKNDRQIKWFWKVVEEMPMERRRVLLIFWTSLRHLPSEGFGGLPSKLYIHRSSSSSSHLPTSHTCFYQLCLPAYPLLRIMRERVNLITQDHVGCSFGRW